MVIEGADGRFIESMAVPAAILASTSGLSLEDTEAGLMPELVGAFVSGDDAPLLDESNLISTILSTQVDLGHGARATIGQMMVEESKYEKQADSMERAGVMLCRAHGTTTGGIHKVVKGGPDFIQCVFFASNTIKRYMIQGTIWDNQGIDQILNRVPGAAKAKKSIAGSRSTGVLIPRQYIDNEIGTAKQKVNEPEEQIEWQ